MAQNRVFVSPGVYTSEKDLSFVTRQVGVTTLGLVGETTKGPAFQPIFISNYNEFMSFFGGLNAKKVKDTGNPQYELAYIAKSYLSKSNQLYVTRPLGFSGYDAGKAWAITVDAAMDPSTASKTAINQAMNLQFTGSTTANTLTAVSNNSIVNAIIASGDITTQLLPLVDAATGDTVTVALTYVTSGATGFVGADFSLTVTTTSTVGTVVTGSTTGTVTTWSATEYTGVTDKVVAVIRSRAKYDGSEILHFELQNQADLIIDSSVDDAALDPMATFVLSGTALSSGFTAQGAFSYEVSFDKTKKNFITRVLGRGAYDGKTPMYVEEIYMNMFTDLYLAGKIGGITMTMVDMPTQFVNYKQEYSPAVTPYVLSEIRGNKVLQLFRLWTISDGNSANEEFKISIVNIKPDDREFDVYVRAFYDTDANPVVLEKFSRCTMDPASASFIGRKIGTTDGFYASKSKFVLVELNEEDDVTDAFPAGFDGVPMRNYTGLALAPNIEYKSSYTNIENKRKAYLGLSDVVGIDQDFLDYKGVNPDGSAFTGKTSAFHLDINASGVTTVDNVTTEFVTGNAAFQNDSQLDGTDYEKLFARKFTFAPYGGFDGWDIYRTRRTNTDTYSKNASGKALMGLNAGNFEPRALTTGDQGNTSDYFAYLEAIRTFANPEAINVNVLATPGIDLTDNTNLVEETIEMVEQERADALYVVTTPDYDGMTADEAVDLVDDTGIDSNYTATYWPWVQVNDVENNVLIYLPATRDVVTQIANTDNIAFPWYAVAGIQRGDMNVVKARKKLTHAEREILYAGRINPIVTWAAEGVKIWGNKNMQVKDSALNRINVRRLLLQARKLISAVALRLLFEQNDDVVKGQFLNLVNPILDNIRSERGLTAFRVEVEKSVEQEDRNELSGKIFIQPTNSLEMIYVEFNVMPNGASFNDV